MNRKASILACIAILTILVIFISIMLISKGSTGKPEPRISIKVGEQIIKPIYYGDRYNTSRSDIERFLGKPFEDGSWEALPYVDLGDEVIIRFENFNATHVRVTEDLLNREGKFLYDEKSTLMHDVELNEDEIRFLMKSNWAVHLSSNSESYKPGHVIKCYVIRAEVDRSDFAFAFVVRTNP